MLNHDFTRKIYNCFNQSNTSQVAWVDYQHEFNFRLGKKVCLYEGKPGGGKTTFLRLVKNRLYKDCSFVTPKCRIIGPFDCIELAKDNRLEYLHHLYFAFLPEEERKHVMSPSEMVNTSYSIDLLQDETDKILKQVKLHRRNKPEIEWYVLLDNIHFFDILEESNEAKSIIRKFVKNCVTEIGIGIICTTGNLDKLSIFPRQIPKKSGTGYISKLTLEEHAGFDFPKKHPSIIKLDANSVSNFSVYLQGNALIMDALHQHFGGRRWEEKDLKLIASKIVKTFLGDSFNLVV